MRELTRSERRPGSSEAYPFASERSVKSISAAAFLGAPMRHAT